MKATFANLTTAVLFAGLTIASGRAVAEAYEIRLQAQNALASIAEDQRQTLREEAIDAMHDQAVAFAGPPAPEASGLASVAESVDATRRPAATAASAAPAPVRAEAPAATSVRRTNKFALPYFSFGKLTQGRKDN